MKTTLTNYLAWLLSVGLLWTGIQPTVAQESIHARKQPKTQSRTAVKEQKRLSLYLQNLSLVQALEEISSQYQVGLAINPEMLPNRKVSLKLQSMTLNEALKTVLAGTQVEGFVSAAGNITLRQRVAAHPQEVVKGRVSDLKTAEPLPGVSILVKGTTTGTATDANGDYSIQVPDLNSVLVFSYISYTTEEVAINGRSTIDLGLAPDIQSLGEVVVVGYGTQNRNEVVGAISSVPTKDIRSRNYNTSAEVLQGTVPGVTVINNGGDPTAQPTINIRGIGSINSESPLLVVDGVVFNGSISSIDPQDIESMSVLKDASAAIYGARASGGVILITTKKGVSGKMRVSAQYQQGFQQVAKKLEALNAAEFADVVNFVRQDAGLSADPAFNPATFPDARTTKTVWMDEIFRSGKIYNVSASVSGGSEKSNFFLSGGYRKNEGVLLNTFAERFTARLNSSHQLHKRVVLGENLSFSLNNGQGANTTSGYTGAILGSIFYPPNATIYRQDGSGKFGGVPEQYAGSYGDVINPVAYLLRLDNRNPVTNLFINPYLEWEIIDGLKFRSNWGYTRIKDDTKNFTSRITEPGKIFDFNELYQSSRTFTSLLNEQTLQYDRTFGQRHSLGVLVGHTYEHWNNEGFNVTATGFDSEDPDQRYLGNANQPIQLGKFSGYADETNLESYLGRLNYSFDQKYILSATVRRDGTSKLVSKNRWEWYPSVSAGWVISRENFFQKVSFVSNLKLRASWGRIGNLGVLGPYQFSVPLSKTQALLGQTPGVVSGLAEQELSNPNLRWESSEQKNIGLDFGFLNNRLVGSVDLFTKNNTRMLLRELLPGVAGVPSGRIVNAGNMENRGVELGLTYQQSIDELQFDLTGNVSFLQNKVKELYQSTNAYEVGPRVRSLPLANIVRVGDPFGAFYGYQTDGLFASNDAATAYVNKDGNRYQPNASGGDLKFVDTNSDGVIDSKDQVILGSVFPKMTYSFNGNLSFKGFDLNLFFQGVSGNKVFNGVKHTGLNASFPGYNLLAEIKNAWTPNNINATVPRLSYRDPNNNFGRVSDFYIEDGDYLRLKSVTLGYTLPKHLLKGIRPRIYFTGQNLLTFTKYTGMDPEVGLNNFGMDLGMYPLSRVYMFGIDVNF
jgi:TonB-dependent starch-binding outer membrane protein SusC